MFPDARTSDYRWTEKQRNVNFTNEHYVGYPWHFKSNENIISSTDKENNKLACICFTTKNNAACSSKSGVPYFRIFDITGGLYFIAIFVWIQPLLIDYNVVLNNQNCTVMYILETFLIHFSLLKVILFKKLKTLYQNIYYSLYQICVQQYRNFLSTLSFAISVYGL